MLPYQTTPSPESNIAIIGLGGAGANVLQCFGSSSADNVKLYSMSLDERVGRHCGNVRFLQLGDGLKHGLGSGGDPQVGREAALASRAAIEQIMEDVRLVVLVVGLGGGTGSGAAPVLAQMTRERGIFLVSVVLMPFAFEGHRRREQAESALNEVSRLSDIVYCFENDYMEELFRNRSGARAVFEEVDRLLAKATASVPTLANSPGMINLGLDELAVALANHDSRCLFGSGSGFGANRAQDAAKAALDSPLFSYHGAMRFVRTVVVHLAGGDTMSLSEIRTAMETVRAALADDEVDVFFGASVKPRLGDEMRVTLIASLDAQEFKMVCKEEEAAAAAAAEKAALEATEPEEAPVPRPEEEEETVPEPEEEAPAPEKAARLYEDEDDEEEPATLFPAAKAPAPATNQVMRQGLLLGDDEEEEQTPLQRTMERYKPSYRAPRHGNQAETDFDTPPSLRNNDLRDIFPDD